MLYEVITHDPQGDVLGRLSDEAGQVLEALDELRFYRIGGDRGQLDRRQLGVAPEEAPSFGFSEPGELRRLEIGRHAVRALDQLRDVGGKSRRQAEADMDRGQQLALQSYNFV